MQRYGSSFWLVEALHSLSTFFKFPLIGYGQKTFSVTQLKVIPDWITLTIFTVIAYLFFGETLKWNKAVSYLLLIGAVYLAFHYQQ